jgi:hypothetical protein
MDRLLTNRKMAMTVISPGVVLLVASVAKTVVAQTWSYVCYAGWPSLQIDVCNDSGTASVGNPDGVAAEIDAGFCRPDAGGGQVHAENGLSAPNGCSNGFAHFSAGAEQYPWEQVDAWASSST